MVCISCFSSVISPIKFSIAFPIVVTAAFRCCISLTNSVLDDDEVVDDDVEDAGDAV